MTPHAIWFILFQSFSNVSAGSLAKAACLLNSVCSAHPSPHIFTYQPKFFVPSKLTTSIFNWWMFTVFTVNWLTLAMSSRKYQIQCKKPMKIDSNRWRSKLYLLVNPRQVFKRSTLPNPIPLNRINTILRSTHDPTNSPMSLRDGYTVSAKWPNGPQCSWDRSTTPSQTWDALISLVALFRGS